MPMVRVSNGGTPQYDWLWQNIKTGTGYTISYSFTDAGTQNLLFIGIGFNTNLRFSNLTIKIDGTTVNPEIIFNDSLDNACSFVMGTIATTVSAGSTLSITYSGASGAKVGYILFEQ